MMPALSWSVRGSALLALCAAAGFAAGQPVAYAAPTFDRWNYPFNSNPGGASEALVFGVLGALGQGQFDDRDGQFLMTWNTSGEFAPGLGAANYEVLAARVTATIDPRFGGAFVYDPTPDSYRTYLDPNDPEYVPDGDAGRPVELFGTGFRNGFNAAAYGETGPFALAGPTLEGVRNAFALDATGVDASNSVRDRFDAVALAIGDPGVAPGAAVPGGAGVSFDLDVQSGAVAAYLQQGLDSGFLSFSIATLHEGAQGGPPTFPVFATKEGMFGGAATLEIDVRIVPGPGGLAVLALASVAMRRRRR